MKNYNELSDQYREYRKLFDKYNIRLYEIANFPEEGGKIIRIHEYYEKSPNARYFSSKPKTIEEKEVDGIHYLNDCTWIGAFCGTKVTGKSYTYVGYIPTRFTSIRPDGNAKSVTIYKFKK